MVLTIITTKKTTALGTLTKIDNVSHYPTPEGVMLTLTTAGIMPRTTAWTIDVLIRGLIVVVCSIPLLMMGEMGQGLLLILLFIINWLYPVYFEVWRNGMTPGKRRQGIYVCHDDGTPISLQSSMIRNLLRVVDFLPFLYSSGMISLMFNKKSQRLGDIVAGTLVVYQDHDDIEKIYKSVYGLLAKQRAQSHNQQYESSRELEYDSNSPLFSFSLNLVEQQAFLSLSDRLLFLPEARQYEITNHLSPLVHKYNKLGMQANNTSQMVYKAVLHKSALLKGNG